MSILFCNGKIKSDFFIYNYNMSKEKQSKKLNNYLKFIEERLNNFDFKAKAKLEAIDDMTEIVLEAKKNYKKNKNENL